MPKIKKDKDTVKPRLIVLAKMFYEHTDEEHQWTNTQILDYLSENKVPANEKTLRGDIRMLKDLGFDIVTIISRPNRYYQRNREFSLPELKLLIDAVSASRFITKKKSQDLGNKLAELSSEHQREELHRNVYATNRVKNRNEGIYGLVDLINEAINSKKKITFQYNNFDATLKPVLRNDGEVYELSPYALYWNEDYYYVVGWSDKHKNVSAFRVDRIVKPDITEEQAHRKPKDFDIDDYSRRIFEMYDGEPTTVKLECKNDYAKYIVDRFGNKLETTPTMNDTFEVEVEVSLSPTFYAWVFQFAGGIRILSPAKAVNEITEMAQKLVNRETI